MKQVSGNGLGGNDPPSTSTALPAYANYGINDSMRVSVRGEYLDYVAYGHAVEGTLTFGYTPVKNFEVRAELRYDQLSNDKMPSTIGSMYLRRCGNDSSESPEILRQ